jgi:hypothetical protein
VHSGQRDAATGHYLLQSGADANVNGRSEMLLIETVLHGSHAMMRLLLALKLS